jgi:hypothetical protein
MTLRSTDKWTLDRRWKKSDNILTIHGADFRSTSSVNVVRGERPSDAALACVSSRTYCHLGLTLSVLCTPTLPAMLPGQCERTPTLGA